MEVNGIDFSNLDHKEVSCASCRISPHILVPAMMAEILILSACTAPV